MTASQNPEYLAWLRAGTHHHGPAATAPYQAELAGIRFHPPWVNHQEYRAATSIVNATQDIMEFSFESGVSKDEALRTTRLFARIIAFAAQTIANMPTEQYARRMGRFGMLLPATRPMPCATNGPWRSGSRGSCARIGLC